MSPDTHRGLHVCQRLVASTVHALALSIVSSAALIECLAVSHFLSQRALRTSRLSVHTREHEKQLLIHWMFLLVFVFTER